MTTRRRSCSTWLPPPTVTMTTITRLLPENRSLLEKKSALLIELLNEAEERPHKGTEKMDTWGEEHDDDNAM